MMAAAVRLAAGMAVALFGLAGLVELATPPADARPVPVSGSGTMAACRFDDGSGSGRKPCVWDARHMGNGYGRSFYAVPVYPFRRTDPVIVYVSHRTAHRLAFGGVR